MADIGTNVLTGGTEGGERIGSVGIDFAVVGLDRDY